MGARIYINNRSPHVQFLSTHRSFRLHRKPSIIFSTLAFNGSSNGYASMGTDLLFASISTAEHRIARAILERHHARVSSQIFGPEVFFSVFFNGCLVSHGLYQAIISTVQQYPPTNNCTLHLHDYITTTINDLNLQQLNNSTVSYSHRSAPKSHTFLTALRSILAARNLYCTPGTSINCPDISTLYRRYIYFYAASTASGHRWSPAATIYNFYAETPIS